MPVTKEFREHVEKCLGQVVPVHSRPMFGGIGIYSEGLFFALIDDDRVFLKVDDTNRGEFERAGTGPFIPYDGAKPMQYYLLPAGLLDDPAKLSPWVDQAIAVAERAARKKAPKRPKL